MTDVLHRLALSVFRRQEATEEAFDHESSESVDAALLDRAECRLSTSLGMVMLALQEAGTPAGQQAAIAASARAG